MNRPLQQLQLCLAPVSKNEAARVGAASMVRDASQRAALYDLDGRSGRCDAPHHEAEGGCPLSTGTPEPESWYA
jgi:hypothetical protein